MHSSTRPNVTSNLCTLLSEHPGVCNEPCVSPLCLIPIVIQGSMAMAALRHGGPHVMLRRRACKWSRQQCHMSVSSTRARRCTEPSSQPSVSRVDAALVVIHQTVLPCDEMKGGGRGRAYKDRAARKVPFEDFAATTGAEEVQGCSW